MESVFKALNDPTRRAILQMLKEKEFTAGEISCRFNLTKPSISHHLDLLKRAELVSSKKEGQFMIYSLNTSVLDDILHFFIQLTQK